jgi:hypothetical protein
LLKKETEFLRSSPESLPYSQPGSRKLRAERGEADVLQKLEKTVSAKDKKNGKLHEVWKESFD